MRNCFLLFILGMMMLTACKNEKKEFEQPVYYKRTAAYENIIKSFSISEQEALVKVVELYNNKSKSSSKTAKIACPGFHIVLIGDWYLFSFPQQSYIDLSGVYVNGKTGQAKEILCTKRIPISSGPNKVAINILDEK